VVRAVRSGRYARLYVYETLLERLAYNLKHMAFEFGPLVSAQKPIMGQGREFRGRAAVANDMSSKFAGGHLRTTSLQNNGPYSIDLQQLVALAMRVESRKAE
jgi:hypothetical protein